MNNLQKELEEIIEESWENFEIGNSENNYLGVDWNLNEELLISKLITYIEEEKRKSFNIGMETTYKEWQEWILEVKTKNPHLTNLNNNFRE